jgi:hypothetical protein
VATPAHPGRHRHRDTTLELDFNGGAGRFTLSGGSPSLVDAHSNNADLRLRRVDREGRADPGTTSRNASVRIDQEHARFGPSIQSTDVQVQVASDVDTTLDLNGGAGEFIVDLREVKLAEADLSVGAASIVVTLPKDARESRIDISAGASSIVIEVPDGVEARITTTGALLSLRSTNPRVTVNGSSGETPGYASSSGRVTVRVTAGASSVTIR